MSAFLGHLQTITTFAPSVLLVSFFFSHMSITNLSLDQRFVVFLAMAKLKRGIGVMILSLIIRISHNVVFWEHHSFVELSHFRASLSSSVLDLFLDEAHILFVATLDPPVAAPDSPVDFSVQPQNILNSFPSSPFNDQVEDEQVEDELLNLELGSPAPTPPEDLAQEIPPRHLTRVRSIPIHLFNYHCYNALATLHKPYTYREASTDPLW